MQLYTFRSAHDDLVLATVEDGRHFTKLCQRGPLSPVDLGVSPKGPASLPSPSVDAPNASVMD